MAASMDPKDLRNMVNELGNLNLNLRELTSNMGKVGTTAKSMSTYFEATQKATEDINDKLEKEVKNLTRIGIAEKLRKTTIKKRSKMLETLQKSEKKAVSLLLTKNLRSEKIQAQTRINNYKKEKREAAIASKFMMRQDEKVFKKRASSDKKFSATEKKEAKKLGEFRRRQNRTFNYGEGERREAITRGTHVGKIAGDVSGAAGKVLRPFKEKSLNPLDWIKTGDEVKNDMIEAQKGMQNWSKVLRQSMGGRKAAASKAAKKAGGVIGGTVEDATKAGGVIGGTVEDATKAGGVIGGTVEDATGKVKDTRKISDNIGGILEDATGRIKKSKAQGIIGDISESVGVGKKGSGVGKVASFTKATQGLGSLVKVVDALGAALGFLGKMNWIFAIISAISALVSAGIELEKFLKGLNKTFLSMAGSTLGSGDIVKNMKDFNDATFDLSRNLKLGLKQEEVQGMFKAVSEGGQAPQVMAEKAGGYGKVIEMVKKSSIDLGLTFEDTGKIINDQMMNLRSSFDRSRKSLQVMGFEATKVGVTVNKFYGAISNTVSALSYMGNFTKQASGALVAFMTESTLSFKDAAQAADDYMTIFNKMDWKQMQVAFAVAGDDMVNAMTEASEKIINQPLAEQRNELKKLIKKIGETENPEDKEKLIKQESGLQDSIRGLEIRAKNLQEGIKERNETGLTGKLQQSISLLTGALPKLITDVRKKYGGTGFTPQLQALKTLIPGLTADMVKNIDNGMDNISTQFEDLNKSFESGIGEQIQGNVTVIDNLKSLVKYGEDNSKNSEILDKIHADFLKQGETIYKKQGDPNWEADALSYADNITKLIGTGNAASEIIIKYLDKLKKLGVKDIKLGATRDDVANVFSGIGDSSKTAEGGVNELNKKEEDIIAAVTSLDDIMKITKDAVHYGLAGNIGGALAGIAGNVGKIAGDVSLLADKKLSEKENKVSGFMSAVHPLTALKMGPEFSTLKGAFIAQSRTEKEIENIKSDTSISEDDKSKKIKEEQNYLDKAKRVIGWGIDNAKKKGISENEITTAGIEAAQTAVKLENSASSESEWDKKQAEEGKKIDKAAQNLVSDKDSKTPSDSIPKNNDFKSLRGGLALLDKGDMAFSPSAGIAGSKGSMAEDVLSKMGLFDVPLAKGGSGGQPVQYAINLGGININGNVEDPMVVGRIGEKLVDMVEQTIRKHDREKMWSKG